MAGFKTNNKYQAETPPESPSKNKKLVLLNGLRVVLALATLVVVIIWSYFWFPAKVHYHIVERFYFSGASEDSIVNLGVLVPKSSSYQETKNLKISWEGNHNFESKINLDVIKVSLELQRGEIIERTIEYDIVLPQGRGSWNAPVESAHILPQKGIESDHPIIIEQASQISNGATQKDAYAIYSFTTNFLTYSTECQKGTSFSALMAYQLGSCVCAGYSRLMVALCRAAGIPAKMVVGIVLPDPFFSESNQQHSFSGECGEAHAWVEYYSEGRWQMADPTWGSRYIRHSYINRNDGRHISFGDYDLLMNEWRHLQSWTTDDLAPSFEASSFPYFITSSANDISFSSEFVIRRTWDGRYMNVFVSWAIFVFLICKYRHRIISSK